jgi:hypothetical protein
MKPKWVPIQWSAKKYKHQVQLILELMMKSKYLSTYLPTYVDR